MVIGRPSQDFSLKGKFPFWVIFTTHGLGILSLLGAGRNAGTGRIEGDRHRANANIWLGLPQLGFPRSSKDYLESAYGNHKA